MSYFIGVEQVVNNPVIVRTKESAVPKRVGGQFLRQANERDKARFCAQLSVLLQAKVPLHRALQALREQEQKPGMRLVIDDLVKELQKGNSLAKALQSRQDVFDPLFVITAEVGQESGKLEDVLTNLGLYLEKMCALKRKFLQAMMYPAIVVCVALFAVTLLLLFVVPTFAELFKSLPVEIPFTTQIILDLSRMLSHYGYYLALGISLALLFGWSAVKNIKVKQQLALYIRNVPIIGNMMSNNHIARFCRTLGTLLQSQVPLLDALNLTRKIITNPEMCNEIDKIVQHVQRGRAVAEPLFNSKFFSPIVAQMISVGEETSNLDVMFLRLADIHEKELDSTIETLSSVIEPIIILLLGLFVAFILISMYLPMFDVVTAVGGL